MIVEPKREILFGPLLRAGVRRCWAAREHLLRLGVVPVLVMVAILEPMQRLMFAAGANASTTDTVDETIMLQILFLGLCYYLALTVFSVNWLRQLTLGSTASPGLGLSLTGRHVRFLLLVIGTSFVSGIVAVFLMLVLAGFGLGGMLAAVMASLLLWAAFMVRISPNWIGIALDARMPIGIAWRRTAGHGFKLLIALLAIEVPVMFVQEAIGILFQLTGLAAAIPLTFGLLKASLQLIATAAQLAVLVTAFPYFLRETV